jgi:hypothetical protein
MFRRLHLRCLRLRPVSTNPTASALPSCPLYYLSPCRNHDWPIRNILRPAVQSFLQGVARSANMFLVDQVGVEPTSKTPFARLHTTIRKYPSLDSNLVLVLSICASHSADLDILLWCRLSDLN